MVKMKVVPLAAVAAAATLFAAGCGSSGGSSSTSNSNSNSNASAPDPTATGSSAAPSAGPTTVNGTLNEWSVSVDKSTVPAGKVTFDVANQGKIVHEFVVLRTGKQADALGRTRRVSEAGNVGETGDVQPGATKKVTLKLKPGHYALVCNIAGHYMSGMHTDFTVS